MKNNNAINYEVDSNDENNIEEIKKIINIRDKKKKKSLYYLGIAIPLIALIIISILSIRQMFIFILPLLFIDIIICVYNFSSYLAYNSAIKLMEKDKKIKSTVALNKSVSNINSVIGIFTSVIGLISLINKDYYGFFLIILGISNMGSSYRYEKKRLKHSSNN